MGEGEGPRRGWACRSPPCCCPSALLFWGGGRTDRVPPKLLRIRYLHLYNFTQHHPLPASSRGSHGIEKKNATTKHRSHDRCDGDGDIGLRADDDAPTDESVPGAVGHPLQPASMCDRTQRRIEFTARGCSSFCYSSRSITLELWPSPARHTCVTGSLWRRPAATGLAFWSGFRPAPRPPRRSCYRNWVSSFSDLHHAPRHQQTLRPDTWMFQFNDTIFDPEMQGAYWLPVHQLVGWSVAGKLVEWSDSRRDQSCGAAHSLEGLPRLTCPASGPCRRSICCCSDRHLPACAWHFPSDLDVIDAITIFWTHSSFSFLFPRRPNPVEIAMGGKETHPPSGA